MQSSTNMSLMGKSKEVIAKADGGIKFVCLNSLSTYVIGALVLPTEFIMHFGDDIPPKVTLHIPSGAVWHGNYKNKHKWIDGLEEFMITYGMRPFHMLALEYVGRGNFIVQLFNPSAVEINYDSTYSNEELEGISVSFFKFPDLEIDSLCSRISCNAFESGRAVSDVVIGRKLLDKKPFYKVFKTDACLDLGIDDTIKWLELGFKSFSWLVKLRWKNGFIYFDKEWYNFAKAVNLKEGDICSFVMTDYAKRFEICVLEKNYLWSCNIKGVGNKQGVMKWFKVINQICYSTGHLEIPRFFVENNGDLLSEELTLFMHDQRFFKLTFTKEDGFIYGMDKIMQTYGMNVGDLMIFTYLENSTFQVSIFSSTARDFWFEKNEKCIAKSGLNESMTKNIVILDNAGNGGGPQGEPVEEEVPGDNKIIDFVVTLKPSHVDNRGHGMYFPRELLHIYRLWKKSTTITITSEGERFDMKVIKKQNSCRLGQGWSRFTAKKGFKVGDKLRFVYDNDNAFEVTVEN